MTVEEAGTEDVEEDWVRVKQPSDMSGSTNKQMQIDKERPSLACEDRNGGPQGCGETVPATTITRPSASTFSLDTTTTPVDDSINKAAPQVAEDTVMVPEHENVLKMGVAGLVMALIFSGVVYALYILLPAASH